MDLQNIDTAALEKELKKRAEKHNIKIAGTIFALNYEEMKAVKEQIDKFFPQPNPWPVFRDYEAQKTPVYEPKGKPFPSTPWEVNPNSIICRSAELNEKA